MGAQVARGLPSFDHGKRVGINRSDVVEQLGIEACPVFDAARVRESLRGVFEKHPEKLSSLAGLGCDRRYNVKHRFRSFEGRHRQSGALPLYDKDNEETVSPETFERTGAHVVIGEYTGMYPHFHNGP